MDIDALFRRYHPSLFRYLCKLTGDADVAADAAQESFVRLLRQDLPEAEARPWLFTVATNLVRDGARKGARRERLLAEIPLPQHAGARADEMVERNEEIERVRAVLARMPERDRQLLLMREEGFRYEEMAQVVGVAPGSVGTLIARALKRFVTTYRAVSGAVQGAGDDSSE